MIRNQETLDLTLAAIAQFVKQRLSPAEEQVDRDGVIPGDIVMDMAQLGLAGLGCQKSTAARG